MTDFILNTLMTRWPEFLGLALTLFSSLLLPWLSRKSSNYKKINKSMIVAGLFHFMYLAVVPLAVTTVGVIVAEIFGFNRTIATTAITYSVLAVISFLLFLLVIRKSKRVGRLLAAAKKINLRLNIMLMSMAACTMFATFANLVFVGTYYEAVAGRYALVVSWGLQLWWLAIVAIIVWKSSDYVYSTITITMMDGDVFHFDCSPKVCRVFRNYVKILKRDENGVVVQELQIHDAAIKQIEFSK